MKVFPVKSVTKVTLLLKYKGWRNNNQKKKSGDTEFKEIYNKAKVVHK